MSERATLETFFAARLQRWESRRFPSHPCLVVLAPTTTSAPFSRASMKAPRSLGSSWRSALIVMTMVPRAFRMPAKRAVAMPEGFRRRAARIVSSLSARCRIVSQVLSELLSSM